MNGLSESLCLDLTIDLASEDSLKAGGLAVLKHVRPSWQPSQIQFKVFTDGITNKLLGAWCGCKEDMVLVRVYGIGTDAIIDRDAEKENMKLLQRIGCGSQLYAEFNNGISYEFIHGDMLSQDRLHDPAVYPLVAQMMAKMHNINTGSKPGLWNKLEHFINTSPDKLKDKQKQIRFAKEYLTKAELREEASQLECLLSSSSSPVVFCHNDVLLANVVVQDDKVLFIDMEYGAPNYAAYDIANHFCEFVGMPEGDGPQLDYEKWFPGRKYQMEWIHKYLTEYHMLVDQPPPTQEQVESTYSTVQQFTLCAHLFWSVWAVIQAHNSNIDFDFLDYAIQRMKEYKRMKNLLGLEKAVES